jgi:hypothetical protein
MNENKQFIDNQMNLIKEQQELSNNGLVFTSPQPEECKHTTGGVGIRCVFCPAELSIDGWKFPPSSTETDQTLYGIRIEDNITEGIEIDDTAHDVWVDEDTETAEGWDYADGLEKQLQDNKKTLRVELLEAFKK